jgi:hypothetical protein
VTFQDAEFEGTSLSSAELRGADFTGARFGMSVLEDAELIGATGLTDEMLAAALRVQTNELGRALRKQFVVLEDDAAIDAALQPACGGTPIAGAGSSPGASFHPMVIFGIAPNFGTTTQAWRPSALRFVELVACVDPDEARDVERCSYVTPGGAPVGDMVRYQHSRRVRVVNAATGAVVRDETLQGPPPAPCPPTVSYGFFPTDAPIGDPVNDGTVVDVLAPLVGEAPQ